MKSTDVWVVSSAKRTVTLGLTELFNSRTVLYALVKREVKSRYRGSLFGFAWALGKPISMLIIFSLVIGEILGASRSIEFYALYVFVGLMFWGFFSESVISGTNSLIQSGGLIQKVAFPREIIPITAVIIALINTVIQLPVLMVGYLAFNAWPKVSNLPLLLITVPTLIFFTLGLTILLSALNVYVRDIQPLTELVISLLIYASPIIYSWTFVKEKVITQFGNDFLFNIYMANPLSALITSFQDSLWPGTRVDNLGKPVENFVAFNSPLVWVIFVISIYFMYLSYRVFLKLEPNFAREL